MRGPSRTNPPWRRRAPGPKEVESVISSSIEFLSRNEQGKLLIAEFIDFVRRLNCARSGNLSFPVRFALERWARYLDSPHHCEMADAVRLLASRPRERGGDAKQAGRVLPLSVLDGVFQYNLSNSQKWMEMVLGNSKS